MQTLQEQTQSMLRAAIATLPSLAIAIVVLIITWLIARSAIRIVDWITGSTTLRPSLRKLIETLVKLGIWIAGVMIAATIILPGLNPANLIAGLGIGALAIGFAFQDVFENFLAGVLIMLREKMRMGDLIEVEGVIGKVENITLRETHIRQLSNELTIMPNAMLFKNPVRILTDDVVRRDEIVVGVSYDTDLDHAASIIAAAVRSIDDVTQDRAIDVFAQEFNSSSVDFLVRWWTASPARDMRATRDSIVRAIKRALDDAQIEIPFPYVTNTFKEPLVLKRREADRPE
ncbi:mechanosensitive ion channel family protein [Croceicoccus sp. F390]|uniref:Small-conductance mechanosensitive channel n=1 Tax=Croceicoccus esteveae TaxID=3075597 RepID=A0ABU2ZDN9_9SPHN|nr:mechanosensitive ion channel family protein [Croceicoccus sp. F390]MDT0574720.1 mechanosensitive ion channel family protein [Croceicoccus sp. F390]